MRAGGARSVRYRAVPRYYITTPIYYVKDAPHVGHAYTTVNADALARWHRLIGDDVFFLTGTDEHGQKVARAAEEQGLAPLEWTDRLAPRFAAAWTDLNVSNDDFIRTTEPRHRDTVQQFLGRINDNGYIFKDTYRGLYCVPCEQYYAEDELVDGGLCPIHRTPVEHLEEENYFFRLSAFEQRLIDWYEAHPDRGDARVEAQRGAQLHQGRPAGHLDHPHVDRVGHPGPVGRGARLLRLVRRPHQLPDRHRLRPRTSSGSRSGGRPSTT